MEGRDFDGVTSPASLAVLGLPSAPPQAHSGLCQPPAMVRDPRHTHMCRYVMYVCMLICVHRLMPRDSYLKKLFKNKMPL